MSSKILSLVVSFLVAALSLLVRVEPAQVNPKITVMGVVYCDICSNNTFSRHSYFMPGARVRIECTIRANSPNTTEEVEFSVDRTTNRYGMYKFEVPSVDGVECAEDKAMESSCRASLIKSSSSSCNVPGYRETADEIEIKSKRANLCIYGLSALNFRPSHKNSTLCKH